MKNKQINIIENEINADAEKRQIDLLVSLRPKKLYHCTTLKKAKRYRDAGAILQPVRGFNNITAAMAWCMRTGRTIIYEFDVKPEFTHKLPDHHNEFGEAWWTEENIKNYKCAWSASS